VQQRADFLAPKCEIVATKDPRKLQKLPKTTHCLARYLAEYADGSARCDLPPPSRHCVHERPASHRPVAALATIRRAVAITAGHGVSDRRRHGVTHDQALRGSRVVGNVI
jgi:hypothetical protein